MRQPCRAKNTTLNGNIETGEHSISCRWPKNPRTQGSVNGLNSSFEALDGTNLEHDRPVNHPGNLTNGSGITLGNASGGSRYATDGGQYPGFAG